MLATRLADGTLDVYVPETCTLLGKWHFKVHKVPVFRVIPNHALMAPFFNSLEKTFLE